MGYIIIKKVGGRFTYYLGKHGRWEGLITNAFEYSSLDQVFVFKKQLEATRHPNDKYYYQETTK